MSNIPKYKHITVQRLHPTFGAEIQGVDFSKPVSEEVFSDIRDASVKYGVLVFRKTGLDDAGHVRFASQFGPLDDVSPYVKAGRKSRLQDIHLFDVSNLDENGDVVAQNSQRDAFGAGNTIFHVDSSFNPRRAGYSLLLAHKLPPKGTGGETDFADTRAAWDALSETVKNELAERDYVIGHSLWHSRMRGAPDYDFGVNPDDHFISRHKLIQKHEASGRTNLYIAAHARYIEDPSNPPPTVGPVAKTLTLQESQAIINELWDHCQQPQFVLRISWENEGDLVVWDNTAVMHRANKGAFMGKFARDVRRATVHDTSSQAWGLNEQTEFRVGLP